MCRYPLEPDPATQPESRSQIISGLKSTCVASGGHLCENVSPQKLDSISSEASELFTAPTGSKAIRVKSDGHLNLYISVHKVVLVFGGAGKPISVCPELESYWDKELRSTQHTCKRVQRCPNSQWAKSQPGPRPSGSTNGTKSSGHPNEHVRGYELVLICDAARSAITTSSGPRRALIEELRSIHLAFRALPGRSNACRRQYAKQGLKQVQKHCLRRAAVIWRYV